VRLGHHHEGGFTVRQGRSRTRFTVDDDHFTDRLALADRREAARLALAVELGHEDPPAHDEHEIRFPIPFVKQHRLARDVVQVHPRSQIAHLRKAEVRGPRHLVEHRRFFLHRHLEPGTFQEIRHRAPSFRSGKQAVVMPGEVAGNPPCGKGTLGRFCSHPARTPKQGSI